MGEEEEMGALLADDHRRSLSSRAGGETLRTTLAWAIKELTENGRSYDHLVMQWGPGVLCKTPEVSEP